jgi:hypothetical protein
MMLFFSLADRVEPPQRTETGEIAVRGAQGKATLDGKRGEMGIGDKVAVHARQLVRLARESKRFHRQASLAPEAEHL